MATQKKSESEVREVEEQSVQNYHLRCKALYEGISKEAWEIIAALAKEDLATFQFREPDPANPKRVRPVPYDAQTICLIAASNDGRQTFYKTLRAMRKTGREIAGKYNTTTTP